MKVLMLTVMLFALVACVEVEARRDKLGICEGLKTILNICKYVLLIFTKVETDLLD